ncbi:TetR/AcrR family transcriptional regulator [Actinomadura citrea]|uniref:AcrR family transcriptional regulator n=1 Tax=Actinomadura citrea TaxID=46158 RepID=A0A7Y9GGD5_9ACTN|nr:TetR/AcrR family transcriptional regulator [Actinomadura citrea]NYE16003.1 AcrR family transcriptional regulator [Actinomadura citrea]GGT68528.1 TetR family transcriptional regulator [Actinomadura citrea]
MAGKSRPPRADAVRNRDKLVVAGAAVFGERGLDAPLEEVARRAGVSIGTLYNHFPARENLFDAIFPARLAALDEIVERSLAEPDPWSGFVGYIEGLFALQAEDRGLNDALARRYPLAAELNAACDRGFDHLVTITARAKEAGDLRPDFEPQDVVPLMWAMSQVIRESADAAPDAWRRCLGFFLDGLRAEAARPLPVSALTAEQMARFTA